MRIAAQFNPTTETSDTFNAGFSNGTGRIVVYNESNTNLLLSWGSFSTYCPAWTAMLYCISANTVNINWQIQSTLISNGAPISQVVVEAYDQGEAIVGTFPAPLVRQTNIGNASSVLSAATSIQNDGQVIGSSVIEAKPTGDNQSAVSLSNDGKMSLGDALHAASLLLTMGAQSVSMDTSGNLTVTRKILANLINTITGNDFAINVETGHRIVFQVNGINIVNMNADGSLQMISGKIELVQGSLARVSIFTGSVTQTGAFANHNLGAIPDAIFFTETNTVADSNSFSYDPSTMTTTQVKVFGGAGLVTPRNFTAMAFKS